MPPPGARDGHASKASIDQKSAATVRPHSNSIESGGSAVTPGGGAAWNRVGSGGGVRSTDARAKLREKLVRRRAAAANKEWGVGGTRGKGSAIGETKDAAHARHSGKRKNKNPGWKPSKKVAVAFLAAKAAAQLTSNRERQALTKSIVTERVQRPAPRRAVLEKKNSKFGLGFAIDGVPPLPTVNKLAPGGVAERSCAFSIGARLKSINGKSLAGLCKSEVATIFNTHDRVLVEFA